MKNRVITTPTEDDALALFSEFECGDSGIIALEADDFIATVNDASTAVAVEGSGSGPERVKDSLSMAMEAFSALAPNLNPYNASKVLCLAVIGEDFGIDETNHLTEFFENFDEDADIIWGVTKEKDKNDVTVRLLLSFK